MDSLDNTNTDNGTLYLLQSQADIKKVMETPEGRRFIHDVLTVAGVYRSSFDENNSHKTAYNEGARFVGLYILDRVDSSCSDLYNKMIEEAQTNDR